MKQNRYTGKTTKIIDKAIQDLMEGKVVVAKDHEPDCQIRRSNVILYYKIMKRLNLEHDPNDFIFDYETLSIRKK